MKIKILALTIILSISASNNVLGQNDSGHIAPPSDPFAELDDAMDTISYEGSESEAKEFEQWKNQYLAEYQNFRQEHFKKVDDIRDNLLSIWGDAEVSSKKESVDYSEDNTVKTVLDFEANEIRISILHSDDSQVEAKNVIDALKAQSMKDSSLALLVGQNVDNSAMNGLVAKAKVNTVKAQSSSKQQVALDKEVKLIKAQAKAQKNEIEKIVDQLNEQEQQADVVQAENSEQVIEKSIKVQKKQIDKETQQRISNLYLKNSERSNQSAKNEKDSLKHKKITTFVMPLANKKDLIKAKPFITQVRRQTDRWELSPSLALAIIHTESYFNPKAQSSVPAFGLMQIVPRTAGVDVNRMLNKKDAPMSQKDLFLPDYNITAGVAYIHILNSRYLRKITNPQSRLYCIIAAYNTGSGNVAKTFNKDKSRNINRAAIIINKLSPEEVYTKLINHLPYKETRDYLERVVKRKDIYAPLESM